MTIDLHFEIQMSYFLQNTYKVYFVLKINNLAFTEQSENAFLEKKVHKGLKYS